MTETEIQAEIIIVETAIRNIMLTGQSYTVGTGPSSRTFTAANLNDIRNYLSALKNDLLAVQGDSGVLAGF